MVLKNLKITGLVLFLVFGALAATPQPDKQEGATLRLVAGPPRVQVEHKSVVTCVAWSADGNRIATGTEARTVRILDAASGAEVLHFTVGNRPNGIAFSPDEKRLAIIEDTSGITIWDVGVEREIVQIGYIDSSEMKSPELVALKSNRDVAVGIGRGGWFGWWRDELTVCFNFIESCDFTALTPDGSKGSWTTATGHCCVASFPSRDPELRLKIGNCHSIALAPNGEALAVGADEKDVDLWGLAEGKRMAKLTGLNKPARKLAFSADGRTLAGLSGDGTFICVWDLPRNATRGQFNHYRGEVDSFAIA